MKVGISIAMCLVGLFFPLTSSAESCWGQGKLTMPFANQELTIQSPSGVVRAVLTYYVEVIHEVCETGELTHEGVEKRYCHSLSRGRNLIRFLYLYGADGSQLRTPDRNTFSVGTGPAVSRFGPCTVWATELTWRGFEAGKGSSTEQEAWQARDESNLDSLIRIVGKVTERKPLALP